MLPLGEPDLGEIVSPPRADGRASVRRPARPGTVGEIRRGQPGRTNLGAKLLDIAADGAQVLIKEPMRAWEVVEIVVAPPGGGQSIGGPAIVCWCVPTPMGVFRAGLQLRHRLTADDVGLLGES
jgi:hypothetical protein